MDLSIVTFTYTNYKNETETRRVVPVAIWFGSTGWHPRAQWFLKAVDLDRGETRDFALCDIRDWKGASDGQEAK